MHFSRTYLDLGGLGLGGVVSELEEPFQHRHLVNQFLHRLHKRPRAPSKLLRPVLGGEEVAPVHVFDGPETGAAGNGETFAVGLENDPL